MEEYLGKTRNFSNITEKTKSWSFCNISEVLVALLFVYDKGNKIVEEEIFAQSINVLVTLEIIAGEFFEEL